MWDRLVAVAALASLLGVNYRLVQPKCPDVLAATASPGITAATLSIQSHMSSRSLRPLKVAGNPVFTYAVAGNHIVGYRVAADGSLDAVTGSGGTMEVPEQALLVAHPSGRYLFAIQRFRGDIEGVSLEAESEGRTAPARRYTDVRVYTVGSNGSLSEAYRSQEEGLFGGLAVHPSGRFIYGIGPQGKIAEFRVGEDGHLAMASRFEVPYTFGVRYIIGAREDWGVTFSPDGRSVFLFLGSGFVDHSENALQRYAVAENGHWQAAGEQWYTRRDTPEDPNEAGPVIFSADGRRAFVCALTGGTRVYRVGQDGVILRQTGMSLPVSGTESGFPGVRIVATAPQGKFIYGGNMYAERPYTVYSLGREGASLVPGSTAFGTRGAILATEPSGKFVYGYNSSSVTAYRMKGDGMACPVWRTESLGLESPLEQLLFVARTGDAHR